jgi:hypothetical protein
MLTEEIKSQIRILNRRIRRIKSGDYFSDSPEDEVKEARRIIRDLKARLKEDAEYRVSRLYELAQQWNFIVTEYEESGLYSLKAKSADSFGYVPSTIAMPLECCYQWLIGYSTARACYYQ